MLSRQGNLVSRPTLAGTRCLLQSRDRLQHTSISHIGGVQKKYSSSLKEAPSSSVSPATEEQTSSQSAALAPSSVHTDATSKTDDLSRPPSMTDTTGSADSTFDLFTHTALQMSSQTPLRGMSFRKRSPLIKDPNVDFASFNPHSHSLKLVPSFDAAPEAGPVIAPQFSSRAASSADTASMRATNLEPGLIHESTSESESSANMDNILTKATSKSTSTAEPTPDHDLKDEEIMDELETLFSSGLEISHRGQTFKDDKADISVLQNTDHDHDAPVEPEEKPSFPQEVNLRGEPLQRDDIVMPKYIRIYDPANPDPAKQFRFDMSGADRHIGDSSTMSPLASMYTKNNFVQKPFDASFYKTPRSVFVRNIPWRTEERVNTRASTFFRTLYRDGVLLPQNAYFAESTAMAIRDNAPSIRDPAYRPENNTKINFRLNIPESADIDVDTISQWYNLRRQMERESKTKPMPSPRTMAELSKLYSIIWKRVRSVSSQEKFMKYFVSHDKGIASPVDLDDILNPDMHERLLEESEEAETLRKVETAEEEAEAEEAEDAGRQLTTSELIARDIKRRQNNSRTTQTNAEVEYTGEVDAADVMLTPAERLKERRKQLREKLEQRRRELESLIIETSDPTPSMYSSDVLRSLNEVADGHSAVEEELCPSTLTLPRRAEKVNVVESNASQSPIDAYFAQQEMQTKPGDKAAHADETVAHVTVDVADTMVRGKELDPNALGQVDRDQGSLVALTKTLGAKELHAVGRHRERAFVGNFRELGFLELSLLHYKYADADTSVAGRVWAVEGRMGPDYSLEESLVLVSREIKKKPDHPAMDQLLKLRSTLQQMLELDSLIREEEALRLKEQSSQAAAIEVSAQQAQVTTIKASRTPPLPPKVDALLKDVQRSLRGEQTPQGESEASKVIHSYASLRRQEEARQALESKLQRKVMPTSLSATMDAPLSLDKLGSMPALGAEDMAVLEDQGIMPPAPHRDLAHSLDPNSNTSPQLKKPFALAAQSETVTEHEKPGSPIGATRIKMVHVPALERTVDPGELSDSDLPDHRLEDVMTVETVVEAIRSHRRLPSSSVPLPSRASTGTWARQRSPINRSEHNHHKTGVAFDVEQMMNVPIAVQEVITGVLKKKSLSPAAADFIPLKVKAAVDPSELLNDPDFAVSPAQHQWQALAKLDAEINQKPVVPPFLPPATPAANAEEETVIDSIDTDVYGRAHELEECKFVQGEARTARQGQARVQIRTEATEGKLEFKRFKTRVKTANGETEVEADYTDSAFAAYVLSNPSSILEPGLAETKPFLPYVQSYVPVSSSSRSLSSLQNFAESNITNTDLLTLMEDMANAKPRKQDYTAPVLPSPFAKASELTISAKKLVVNDNHKKRAKTRSDLADLSFLHKLDADYGTATVSTTNAAAVASEDDLARAAEDIRQFATIQQDRRQIATVNFSASANLTSLDLVDDVAVPNKDFAAYPQPTCVHAQQFPAQACESLYLPFPEALVLNDSIVEVDRMAPVRQTAYVNSLREHLYEPLSDVAAHYGGNYPIANTRVADTLEAELAVPDLSALPEGSRAAHRDHAHFTVKGVAITQLHDNGIGVAFVEVPQRVIVGVRGNVPQTQMKPVAVLVPHTLPGEQYDLIVRHCGSAFVGFPTRIVKVLPPPAFRGAAPASAEESVLLAHTAPADPLQIMHERSVPVPMPEGMDVRKFPLAHANPHWVTKQALEITKALPAVQKFKDAVITASSPPKQLYFLDKMHLVRREFVVNQEAYGFLFETLAHLAMRLPANSEGVHPDLKKIIDAYTELAQAPDVSKLSPLLYRDAITARLAALALNGPTGATDVKALTVMGFPAADNETLLPVGRSPFHDPSVDHLIERYYMRERNPFFNYHTYRCENAYELAALAREDYLRVNKLQRLAHAACKDINDLLHDIDLTFAHYAREYVSSVNPTLTFDVVAASYRAHLNALATETQPPMHITLPKWKTTSTSTEHIEDAAAMEPVQLPLLALRDEVPPADVDNYATVLRVQRMCEELQKLTKTSGTLPHAMDSATGCVHAWTRKFVETSSLTPAQLQLLISMEALHRVAKDAQNRLMDLHVALVSLNSMANHKLALYNHFESLSVYASGKPFLATQRAHEYDEDPVDVPLTVVPEYSFLGTDASDARQYKSPLDRHHVTTDTILPPIAADDFLDVSKSISSYARTYRNITTRQRLMQATLVNINHDLVHHDIIKIADLFLPITGKEKRVFRASLDDMWVNAQFKQDVLTLFKRFLHLIYIRFQRSLLYKFRAKYITADRVAKLKSMYSQALQQHRPHLSQKTGEVTVHAPHINSVAYYDKDAANGNIESTHTKLSPFVSLTNPLAYLDSFFFLSPQNVLRKFLTLFSQDYTYKYTSLNQLLERLKLVDTSADISSEDLRAVQGAENVTCDGMSLGASTKHRDSENELRAQQTLRRRDPFSRLKVWTRSFLSMVKDGYDEVPISTVLWTNITSTLCQRFPRVHDLVSNLIRLTWLMDATRFKPNDRTVEIHHPNLNTLPTDMFKLVSPANMFHARQKYDRPISSATIASLNGRPVRSYYAQDATLKRYCDTFEESATPLTAEEMRQLQTRIVGLMDNLSASNAQQDLYTALRSYIMQATQVKQNVNVLETITSGWFNRFTRSHFPANSSMFPVVTEGVREDLSRALFHRTATRHLRAHRDMTTKTQELVAKAFTQAIQPLLFRYIEKRTLGQVSPEVVLDAMKFDCAPVREVLQRITATYLFEVAPPPRAVSAHDLLMRKRDVSMTTPQDELDGVLHTTDIASRIVQDQREMEKLQVVLKQAYNYDRSFVKDTINRLPNHLEYSQSIQATIAQLETGILDATKDEFHISLRNALFEQQNNVFYFSNTASYVGEALSLPPHIAAAATSDDPVVSYEKVATAMGDWHDVTTPKVPVTLLNSFVDRLEVPVLETYQRIDPSLVDLATDQEALRAQLLSQNAHAYVADNLYLFNPHVRTSLETMRNMTSTGVKDKLRYFPSTAKHILELKSFLRRPSEQEYETYVAHGAITALCNLLAKCDATKNDDAITHMVRAMQENVKFEFAQRDEWDDHTKLQMDCLAEEFFHLLETVPVTSNYFRCHINTVLNEELARTELSVIRLSKMKQDDLALLSPLRYQMYSAQEPNQEKQQEFLNPECATAVVDLLSETPLSDEELAAIRNLGCANVVFLFEDRNLFSKLQDFVANDEYAVHSIRLVNHPHSTKAIHSVHLVFRDIIAETKEQQ